MLKYLHMFEKPPTTPRIERGPESHPSEENITAQFEKLVEGKKFVELKKEFDENGLQEWEIRITHEDNSTTEYLYGRKGDHARGHRQETTIHVAHFDKDGFPEGGNAIMKYREGEWIKIV